MSITHTLRPPEKEWLSFQKDRNPHHLASMTHPWHIVQKVSLEEYAPSTERILEKMLLVLWERSPLYPDDFVRSVNTVIEKALEENSHHFVPVLLSVTQNIQVSEDFVEDVDFLHEGWGSRSAGKLYGKDAQNVLKTFSGSSAFVRGFEKGSWHSLAGKNMQVSYDEATPDRKRDVLLRLMESFPRVKKLDLLPRRPYKKKPPVHSITGPGLNRLWALCLLHDEENVQDAPVLPVLRDKILSCIIPEKKMSYENVWHERTLYKQARQICSSFFFKNLNNDWLIDYVKKCTERKLAPPFWIYKICHKDFLHIDLVQALQEAPLVTDASIFKNEGEAEERRKMLAVLSDAILREHISEDSSRFSSKIRRI